MTIYGSFKRAKELGLVPMPLKDEELADWFKPMKEPIFLVDLIPLPEEKEKI